MSPKKSRHSREYLFFRLFTLAVGLTPRFLRGLEAKTLAALFPRFSRRRHQLVTSNLGLAFPQWDAPRRRRLQRRIYRHFSRVMVELAALIPSKTPEKSLKSMDIRGADHLQAALSLGKGVIVFSGHMGNWELLPGGIRKATGSPAVSVARPLDNPRIDRRIRLFRERMGSRLVNKRGAMRAMLKALDQRETVFMLIDQNAVVREGVFVDFFGLPVSAVTSAAQIHLRRGTPLVPAFITLKRGQPVVEFHPALTYSPTGDRDRDITAVTQQCTSEIEAAIRRSPEQWFWFHDRWKTRPRGDHHATH